MKKILALALALLMVLALAACGNTTDPGTSRQEPSNTPDEGSGENNNDEKNGLEKYGLTLVAITPANSTGSDVKEDTGSTYSLSFTMSETVTEEVAFAYYKQVYDLTASISEGGVNYKKTGGTSISPEVGPMGSWDEENSGEFNMNAWFYKYDGKLFKVTIAGGIGYDTEILVSVYDFT
ncbi:MAG TPA: hypothetical protein PLT66_03300 [Bacillota bacterium]|nr:hypothetical protein [Bacillota bacterium]